MIISHKYKYIFIKPKKVAGTSIEVALAQSLGKDDIFPPLTEYSPNHDKDFYKLKPQNFSGYYDHEPPERIRKKIGEKIWRSYFKFTVARNPWDLAVSSYWWEVNKKVTLKDYKNVISVEALLDYMRSFRKLIKPKDFDTFVKNFPEAYVNTNYYFTNKSKKPIANFYIRYENLDQDFKKVCKDLKIPYRKLLSLKSKTRPHKKHYSEYFTNETKEIIRKLFKKEIAYFNYRFEDQPRHA